MALRRPTLRDAPRIACTAEPAPRLSILQEIAEGIVILDHDGIVRFVNREAEAILGRTRASLVGQPLPFGLTDALVTTITAANGHVAELRTAPSQWAGEPGRVVSVSDITLRTQIEGGVPGRERLHDLAAGLLSLAHRMMRERPQPDDARYGATLEAMREAAAALASALTPPAGLQRNA